MGISTPYKRYIQTIGDRIRKYRKYRGLTQKQLAEACDMSESAIRNYELGNRIPDQVTLLSISDALDIDRVVLQDVDAENVSSLEFLFTQLEDLYHLVPKMIDGNLHLVFESPSEDESHQSFLNYYYLKDLLLHWCSVRDAYLAGKFSEEDYKEWKLAHIDVIGFEPNIESYHLTLEEQIDEESRRRALGLVPIPLFDKDHNLVDIPKHSKAKNTNQAPSKGSSNNKRKSK